MKRRIVLVLSVLLLVTLAFVACDEAALHTYTDAWSFDENNHWHAATCTDTEVCKDAKAALAAHADANNDKVCDVCAYDYGHTHTYADTWTADENGHSYAATCGCAVASKDAAAHVDANNDGACDVCAYNGGHEHTYNTEAWAADETNHWYAATCSHDVVNSSEAHDFDETTNMCEVCGYVQGGMTISNAVAIGNANNGLVNGGFIVYNNGYDAWSTSSKVVNFAFGNNYAAYEMVDTSYGPYYNYMTNTYDGYMEAKDYMNTYYLLNGTEIFGVQETSVYEYDAEGNASLKVDDQGNLVFNIEKAYAPESALLTGYKFDRVFGFEMSDDDIFYGTADMITALYEKAVASGTLEEYKLVADGEGDTYVFAFTTAPYAGYDENYEAIHYIYNVQVMFTLGEGYSFENVQVVSSRYLCQEIVEGEGDAAVTTYIPCNVYPISMESYTVMQTVGERNATPKYDPAALLMSDFNLYNAVYDDSWNLVKDGDAITDTLTVEAGSNVSLLIEDITPETALISFDNITAAFTDGTTNINTWKNELSFRAPSVVGTYAFTVKGIATAEKTYTLVVVAPEVSELYAQYVVEGITYTEDSYTANVEAGTAVELIVGAVVNAGADGSYTAALADGTTATLVNNNDGTYTFTATEYGTYVITLTSTANTEITATLTVTVEEPVTQDVTLDGVWYIADGSYVTYFTFADGVLTIDDGDNGVWYNTFSGTYNYTVDGEGYITFADNVSFTIAPATAGVGYTFAAGAPYNIPATLMTKYDPMAGTWTFSEMGYYVNLTFENGTLTVDEDWWYGGLNGTYAYTVDGDGNVTIDNDGAFTLTALGDGTYSMYNTDADESVVVAKEGGDNSGSGSVDISENEYKDYTNNYQISLVWNQIYDPTLGNYGQYFDITWTLDGDVITIVIGDATYAGVLADATYTYDATTDTITATLSDTSTILFERW